VTRVHEGQVIIRASPQLLHTFWLSSIGARHFGQRNGPIGLIPAQNGQTFASGGTSSPQ
jgi:hypothetical protein